MGNRKWEEKIRQIRQNLAAAYGGYSQFGSRQIAEAIRGHFRNSSLHLGVVGEVNHQEWIEEAATQEVEQWEQLDYEVILKEIAAAYEAEIQREQQSQRDAG
jgi:hypothetical protein